VRKIQQRIIRHGGIDQDEAIGKPLWPQSHPPVLELTTSYLGSAFPISSAKLRGDTTVNVPEASLKSRVADILDELTCICTHRSSEVLSYQGSTMHNSRNRPSQKLGSPSLGAL
jgi:hypothetical protein